MEYLRRHSTILLLTVAAAATRLAFLTHPAEVVFDEVYFGKFVSAYFTHEYFFDIHPPLGKLLIAGLAWLSGFRGGGTFTAIGDAVDPRVLGALRGLPALAGAALVPLTYAFLRAIGGSRRAAHFGAALVLFDNALLVESRFALLDILLLSFGVSALTLAAYAFRAPPRSRRRLLLLVAATAAAASAVSVKWTGLSFLGIIAVAVAFDTVRRRDLREFAEVALILTLIPAALYVAIFALHFHLLSLSGTGDPFMSEAFQRGLSGNTHAGEGAPLGFLAKFRELNRVMYTSSAHLTATHPDGSRWYEWPFMVRPIWYWTERFGISTANIFFIGNPVVWWSAFGAVVVSAFGFLLRRPWTRSLPDAAPLLLLGYVVNLLPFLAVRRVSFLYHYLPALLYAIAISALFFDRVILPAEGRRWVVGFFGAVVLAFLLVAPLTYGIPLPPGFSASVVRLLE